MTLEECSNFPEKNHCPKTHACHPRAENELWHWYDINEDEYRQCSEIRPAVGSAEKLEELRSMDVNEDKYISVAEFTVDQRAGAHEKLEGGMDYNNDGAIGTHVTKHSYETGSDARKNCKARCESSSCECNETEFFNTKKCFRYRYAGAGVQGPCDFKKDDMCYVALYVDRDGGDFTTEIGRAKLFDDDTLYEDTNDGGCDVTGDDIFETGNCLSKLSEFTAAQHDCSGEGTWSAWFDDTALTTTGLSGALIAVIIILTLVAFVLGGFFIRRRLRRRPALQMG